MKIILALLGALVIAQGADSDECKKAVQQVVVNCAPAASVPKQDKVDKLAEKQRQWFQNWYKRLGFQITVPKPAVSDCEFARRQKLQQSLVYRPASQAVSYDAFMNAVGQGRHWTVVDQAERAKILWEPTPTGYWFWTEVAAVCPRLRRSWGDLNQVVRLLSLEEYMIVRYVYEKIEVGWVINSITSSWLRTRFGAGALVADEFIGQVFVYGYDAEYMLVPCDGGGGRAAEVVPTAP